MGRRRPPRRRHPRRRLRRRRTLARLRQRSRTRASRRHRPSPTPRRLPPMRYAETTKTVWSDYPRRPTSDGLIRLLIDLRCEKLRPQLLHLAERLDDKLPVCPCRRCSRWVFKSSFRRRLSRRPLYRRRECERTNLRNRPARILLRARLSQNAMRPSRQPPTCRSFLLAFFGGGPRNSSGVHRTQVGGGH